MNERLVDSIPLDVLKNFSRVIIKVAECIKHLPHIQMWQMHGYFLDGNAKPPRFDDRSHRGSCPADNRLAREYLRILHKMRVVGFSYHDGIISR